MTTLQISTPVLAAGQLFKIIARKMPAGVVVEDLGTRTNAPFSVNLAPGTWQLEIAIVGQESCPKSYYDIVVTEPAQACNCPMPMDAQIVRNTSSQKELRITYTPPAPACGFIVKYGEYNVNGGGGQLNYQTATFPNPTGGVVSFPVTGDKYDVIVQANCCKGEVKQCFEKVAIAPTLPADPCTPWGLPGTTHSLTLERIGTQWRIKLVRKMPPDPQAPTSCESIRLWVRQQFGAVTQAAVDDFTLVVAPGDFAFSTIVPNDTLYIPVRPFPAPDGATVLFYYLRIIDCCRTNWGYIGETNGFYVKDFQPYP